MLDFITSHGKKKFYDSTTLLIVARAFTVAVARRKNFSTAADRLEINILVLKVN